MMCMNNSTKPLLLSLLFLLSAAVAAAQSAMDYSSLSESNPVNSLSVTEGGYKAALAEGGGWTALSTSTNSVWKTTWKDAFFQQSISTLKTYDYECDLLSPALDLKGVSGKKLSFKWSAGSVKGDVQLLVRLVDKSGTQLASLKEIAPVAGSSASDYTEVALTLPSLEGVGFLSFYTKGSSKTNRASFCLQDISVAETTGGEDPGTGGEDPQTGDKPTVELLTDNCFYDFTGTKPVSWEVSGETTKLEGSDCYDSTTGYAIGLKTGDEKGYVRQTVDLKASGKEVVEGDEIEGELFYYTKTSSREEGPFRLVVRWLNDNGEEVASAEDAFINNPDLYFGRRLTYGRLRFRMVCPKGAVKMEFGVEVAPQSEVRLDDFSAMRLAEADKTPLVAILPQYRTVEGEVGKQMSLPVVMQGMHLTADQQASYSGTDAANVLSLANGTLPQYGVVETTLTVTPTTKGAFTGSKAYTVTFSGAEPDNTGSLMLSGYFMAAGKKPAIAVSSTTPLREMTAEPGKTDTQTLTFDITDVISSVNIAVNHVKGKAFRINTSQFYYLSKSDKVVPNSLKIDFAPTEAGDYETQITLTSPLADPLVLTLKGTCKAQAGEALVEKFSADNKMDSRFTGDAWTGYHKFDLGYWKLDGTWNAAGDITLSKGGTLYLDEIQANGVHTVTVSPWTDSTVKLEYSVDGGGHWTEAPLVDSRDAYSVATHRPTFLRLVNVYSADITLNSVTINPSAEADRENYADIKEAMLTNADDEPMTLLNESFNGLRHTRVLGLPGWQNLTTFGERPFYAWQQKNDDNTQVENEVAQISFFRWGIDDSREQESWLISPTLSYKNAASKVLTFSLRFQNPTDDGQEQFGFYILAENSTGVMPYYIDLTQYVPDALTIEAEQWFNYYIDLSEIDGLNIDDRFHVAYSYYSPVGGNATLLTWMLDDVTFGRTDLPELTVDKELLSFEFQTGLRTDEQTVNVTAERATAPVTFDLTPSTMGNFFEVKSKTLVPNSKYEVGVSFKSDDTDTRAAALLVQSRGAKPVMVKLLAQNKEGTGINAATTETKTAVSKVYTLDGRELSRPQRGVNIIRTTDGKTRKYVVK